jgi:cytochrome P450
VAGRRHPAPGPARTVHALAIRAEEVVLAGVVLGPGTPVLVDVAGLADDPDAGPGAGLAFGAGPHVCAGAHLARAELAAVVDVLVGDFSDARLAVPAAELRRVDPGTTGGSRSKAFGPRA